MQKIKIPKFEKNEDVKVYVRKWSQKKVGNALMIYCLRQTIKGIDIPSGFKIYIPWNSFGGIFERSSNYLYIKGWKMNEVIRTLVIQKLHQEGAV